MYVVISNSSELPIYKQIYEQIKQQIISAELTEGEALPSIRKLAKEIRVSVITTKKAFEELEKDGLVVGVGGKGTFVAPQNLELIKEHKLRLIEEKIGQAIGEAKLIGLGKNEIIEIFELLYEEER